MSMISRLFEAPEPSEPRDLAAGRRRKPELAAVPRSEAPATRPVAAATPAVEPSIDVIGSFAGPAALADDEEPVDVFGRWQAPAPSAIAGLAAVAAGRDAARPGWRPSSRHVVGLLLVGAALVAIADGLGWLRGEPAPPPVKGAAVQAAPAADAVVPAAAPAPVVELPAAKPDAQVAAAVPAPAPANGTLQLAISPWGEVFVEGIGRGVTPPLDRIDLPAGTYRVEVRNPAAPRYSTKVEVRAGESVTLQHRF